MKLRRLILIFIFIAISVMSVAGARTFSYNFRAVRLSEALATIAEQHPEVHINFIYNELDNYLVTAHIDTDDAYKALKQAVGLNPVSVAKKDGRFFIEALQHGKFVYTGHIVGKDGEPVAGATVMLLSPNDSTVLTYSVAESDGKFRTPCDHQGVIAKISCLGYSTLYHKCRTYALGTLTMTELPVTLKGVQVRTPEGTLYADRSVYRPSSRQRGSAQNAIDLLRLMALPSVSISLTDNSVSTNTGGKVAVFVDGHEASDDELQGLLTSDVRYVEYLDFPTSPQFSGNEHVINFVMQKYEYGGYAKGSVSENFLTGLSSSLSVYAKFVYKSMTYDIYAGADNRDFHHAGTSSDAEFTLRPAGGIRTNVERIQTSGASHYRENEFPVSFRAIYASEIMHIGNTAAFTFSDTPTAMCAGNLSFSRNIADGHSYRTDNPVRSRLLSWHGDYRFVLWRGAQLTLKPSAVCNRLTDDYYYQGNGAAVANLAEEKHLRFGGSAGFYQTIARRHSVRLEASYDKTRNDVDYSGTSPYFNKFSDTFSSVTLGYEFRNSRWSAGVDASLQRETDRINNDSIRESYPMFNVSLGFTPDTHHAFRAFFHHGANCPDAGDKTPNVLRENELLYKTGNPLLGLSRQMTFSLTYDWIPDNRLAISAYARYFSETNMFVPCFMLYNGGRALLRTLKSDADYRRTQAGLSFRWRLLDGDLQLAANPSVTFYRMTGEYDISRNPFAINASATYYLGDFYFQASYQSRLRTIRGNRAAYYRERDFYRIQAGWRHRNLNVRLSVINLFRNDWLCSTTEFSSPDYTETSRRYGTACNRRLNLSITYSFGYGKKVNRTNEIGEQTGASSAVLK